PADASGDGVETGVLGGSQNLGGKQRRLVGPHGERELPAEEHGPALQRLGDAWRGGGGPAGPVTLVERGDQRSADLFVVPPRRRLGAGDDAGDIRVLVAGPPGIGGLLRLHAGASFLFRLAFFQARAFL